MANVPSATGLLQQLIRLNTVNPPGNERPAIELLAGLLEDAGFAVTTVGNTPERPNLVAELRATDPAAAAAGPVLGLLSHVDTVLASPEDWQHDPWGGELIDGVIWGRGAIDMKSQTAAEVTAAIDLARSGWRPARGALKVIVVVDEEVGGYEGAVWLTREHPELAACDLLLNEGGGAPMPFRGRLHYGVCVGEKGPVRFLLRARGRAAHASTPGLGDNALLKLVPLLQRLADAEFPYDLEPAIATMLDGLGLDGADPAASYAALRAEDPALAAAIEPMSRIMLSPTQIAASDKLNVIPSRAELRVDCRVPPGLTEAQAQARILDQIGPLPDDVEIEWTETILGNASPEQSPLMDALREWIGEQAPEATIVPTFLPGFTDSRTWRTAFPDCVAYGFFPHRHLELREQAGLMHAKDERIDERDLDFATRCYRDVVARLLG
ncbi:acetylornithine deacetylase or succinyl-diaminopimelate desuccinylase [Patulibacter medicamentivorans]|jgi:acetylornithine deacetylase/succinyl-diaminopimelate desuccinylase-like protein|uniref:Acetylornithine deacetylase or succinyl-diaminopimelate desuccinylase n=1 Tax=Patulibacter medicamentivorans TaxID=1097667 RepID=H0E4T5_9ACTN|nr:M20/M25/M40 family metallo-hydrolase [Patulibacter medicamentivorans]EHN11321.1 acetylornithine deacetylase or succinyl-diaminopimelate desuccinylase [Patulibacter medicamentivorans]